MPVSEFSMRSLRLVHPDCKRRMAAIVFTPNIPSKAPGSKLAAFSCAWSDLMSPSGNGRKSLAFRRSLEVKRPCADISDDESHEIRSEVPLGMDYQIPPGGAEWGGGDAGARTGARDL